MMMMMMILINFNSAIKNIMVKSFFMVKKKKFCDLDTAYQDDYYKRFQ